MHEIQRPEPFNPVRMNCPDHWTNVIYNGRCQEHDEKALASVIVKTAEELLSQSK